MRRSLMDAIKNAYFHGLKKPIIGFFDEPYDGKSGLICSFSQKREAGFMLHSTFLMKKPEKLGCISIKTQAICKKIQVFYKIQAISTA